MDIQTMRRDLRDKGFVVIRGLLTQEEVGYFTGKLEALSGISRQVMAASNKGGKLGQRGLENSWSTPDGVTKNPDFWPLITHERLVTAVRGLLGEGTRFLQHTDLHVGFSAISWHRDNVNRDFGKGPDWDERDAPYRLLRVGIYLQSYAESGFRLGFIPGTHRPLPQITLGRRLQEARLKWVGAMSYLFVRLQEWASQAEWVATEPGDCLIFDPRILHSGSYITGPKFSMFLAYGIENRHFYNHVNYYRRMRQELGYDDLSPALAEKLQTADLLPGPVPVYDHVEGAWSPPPLVKRLVKRGLNRA